MVSIAFIDYLGLEYNGNTPYEKGLGGSESALVYLAEKMSQIGFNVTVFNNCDKPGTYKGVEYRLNTDLINLDKNYDVVVSSRSVRPFKQFKFLGKKIIWLHDTFCEGDQLLEQMVVDGEIDEIFTLSDFHTSYITNCEHGHHRNFEVLKRHVFQTRNGVVNQLGWVDVSKKDKNQLVYSAAASKGLRPLLELIWPRLKTMFPNLKLTVIGGYYDIKGDNDQKKMTEDFMAKNPDVTFTGIISQKEVAEILAKSALFLYPCEFPETYGMSMVESMMYGTPMVTCRFGATEETAFEQANYVIDYPIVPNPLFQGVDQNKQVEAFVQKVQLALTDQYLYQQKVTSCFMVKDICSWKHVALQWKEHLFNLLGLYMPISEHRELAVVKYKASKVFGRRFQNKEDIVPYKLARERHILVVVPYYNASQYIAKCIESIAAQDYENYLVVLINDCSTDNSKQIADATISNLENHYKFINISQSSRYGAVNNQYNYALSYSEDLIMLVDGDDALTTDPHIFTKYNTEFTNRDLMLSYGSCWSMADNIPLVAQEYPPHVREAKTYRHHELAWGIPYTHLRVFTKELLETKDFVNKLMVNGQWPMAGGDAGLVYALLEAADHNKIWANQEVVYLYNDLNPINDYKVNSDEQTSTANHFKAMSKETQMPTTAKKKILIAIPTDKYIESQTFKSIYDLEIPDGYEVIFQYFHGYRIDQIRNLIADWVVNYKFDYLFAVDSDIGFKPDTLKLLLEANKPIISGLYRQRFDNSNLELYDTFGRIKYDDIKQYTHLEVKSCGFGCVLIKHEVFASIPYPHFEYKPAIDHANTLSEDTDFCLKAIKAGYSVWAHCQVLCDHFGRTNFSLQ